MNDVSFSLMFVGDKRMRSLNKKFRNKDKTTDVLSFELVPPFYPFCLGDIVISVDTAKRQAKEFHHELYEEINILLIHGLLHLLKYDHEKSKKEFVIMKKLENEIAEKVLKNPRTLISRA